MRADVQQALTRRLLAPLGRGMDRLPRRARDGLFVLSGTLIFLVHFANQAGLLAGVRYLWWFAADCLLLGLMLLALLPRDPAPAHWRRSLLAPWLGVGAFLLLAGLTRSEDYLPDAMLFLVAYPLFFLAGARCWRRMLALLLRTVQWSFLAFLAVTLARFPVTGGQYAGLFRNPNGLGFYLALTVCCAFLSLLGARRPGAALPALGTLGLSGALLYYSASRTGMLAAGLGVGLTALVMLTGKGRLRLALTRLLPAVLSVALFLPAGVALTRLPQTLAGALSAPAQTVQAAAPAEDTPSPGAVLDDIRQANDRKVSAQGKDLSGYSSGRLSIWTGYLPLLGLWGHGEPADVVIPPDRHYSSAHQTVLQLCYDCGIPGGLCFLAFNLLAGLRSLELALRRRDDPAALAPFALSVTYGVISLLASVYTSFYTMAALCYCLAQCPLMTREGFEGAAREGAE